MRDEYLNCDCSFSAGCKFEIRRSRPYVMKKPRGPRGPYRGATKTALAKLAVRYPAKHLEKQT